MIDVTPETKDAASSATATVDSSAASNKEEGTSFAERYSEVLGKVNETLDQVDWNQMGRISKIVGIFAAGISSTSWSGLASSSRRDFCVRH